MTAGPPPVWHKALNVAGFQAVWWSAVLGAAAGRPWLGVVVGCVAAGLHLALNGRRAAELRLLAAAGVLGWLAESALVLSGAAFFPAAAQWGWPAPYWMVALWVAFATTFRVSMGWLRGRYVAGAVFGAVLGPLSYLAGERLGAIVLGTGGFGLGAVSLEWLIAMPLLVEIERRTR